jgi:hypothetical protein
MRWLLLLLLLGGCVHTTPIAHTLSPKKQKQRIHILEKKLEGAKQELRKAQDAVEEIEMELEGAQIALVKRSLDEYEKKHPKQTELFVEEKEVLYRLIREGPNPGSFAAQAELDRLQRLSTESSE